jgi:hypothetical protein
MSVETCLTWGDVGDREAGLARNLLSCWSALPALALPLSSCSHRWNIRKIFNLPPESIASERVPFLLYYLPRRIRQFRMGCRRSVRPSRTLAASASRCCSKCSGTAVRRCRVETKIRETVPRLDGASACEASHSKCVSQLAAITHQGSVSFLVSGISDRDAFAGLSPSDLVFKRQRRSQLCRS